MLLKDATLLNCIKLIIICGSPQDPQFSKTIMKHLLFFTLIFSFILSSCSIEKRHYNKGLYFQRNTKFSSDKISNIGDSFTKATYNDSENVDFALADEKSENELYSNIESISISSIKREKINQIIKQKDENSFLENCDLITTKKGDEIECIVKEISSSEIKYVKCNNINSPIISVRKSDVLFIKYANGEKDVINSSSSDPITEQIVPSNGGKSQLVAFLLCFFFGLLGIHRFYLGHIGMGILYLLTAGLCGIGALIDLILILVGSMKPKDGEYEKTF
jgi:TM2 domain-containing membrane protein YozV/Zn finger protein HypA/HybF involved in hydrogenase expression